MSNVIETLIASETPAELRRWLQLKLSELPSESDYTRWGWVDIIHDEIARVAPEQKSLLEYLHRMSCRMYHAEEACSGII